MVIDEPIESARPLGLAQICEGMFARTAERQLVSGAEVVIDAEVDLVTVGEVSLAASGERVRSKCSTKPSITRGIQTIDAWRRLEIIRQRHRVENRAFDQTALIRSRAQRVQPKYADRPEITRGAWRLDRISCQINGGNICRRSRILNSREIAENALPRCWGQDDGRHDRLLYRPLPLI